MMRIGLAAAYFAIAVASACPAAGAEAAIITIAAAAPLSGPYSRFGKQMKAGAELAVADINRAGGVRVGDRRRYLKLIVDDDGCDRQSARKLAAKLAASGAIFVAGHFCSGASIAAAEIYAQKGIIQIAPASRHPRLTDRRAGPTIFRLSGRDDLQGLIAGRYLASAFPVFKIAIIHDGTLYARKLVAGVRKGLKESGIREKILAQFRAARNDYSRLLRKLAKAKIEVLYIAGYATEAAVIARRLADRGMGLALMTGDVAAAQEFRRIAGTAGEGVLLTSAPDPSASIQARTVVAALRVRNIEPDATALYSYGAVQTWRLAVERAKSLDTDAIVDELNRGVFDTALGRFSFDAKGDSSLPSYAIYKWSNGALIGLQGTPP